MVVVAVVSYGPNLSLFRPKLHHPIVSVSVSSIALLKKADQRLSGLDAITLLPDRIFPSYELLACFNRSFRWIYRMRIRAHIEV